MDSKQFNAAVNKLEAAITDEEGQLRPISRIEFEILSSRVRWNLWEGSRRLHSLTDLADQTHGFLAASKMIMEIRARDAART